MAMSTWFLYIVIMVIVFVFIKVVMKKQAIATKLAFFIFIFLMITIGHVYTTSGIEVHSTADVLNFTGVYFSWLSSLFHNVKAISANAVSQDWSVNNTEMNG